MPKLDKRQKKNIVIFFTENMVDEEVFVLLDESSLKEMILADGPRIKLQRKLQELQVRNNLVFAFLKNVFSPI